MVPIVANPRHTTSLQEQPNSVNSSIRAINFDKFLSSLDNSEITWIEPRPFRLFPKLIVKSENNTNLHLSRNKYLNLLELKSRYLIAGRVIYDNTDYPRSVFETLET